MAQRLLLVALCAVIAVQLISSVEGARKSGCIVRCNSGCRKRHSTNLMTCLKNCWQTYPRSCQKCKKNDERCYGCLPGFMLSNAKCIPCAIGCICDENSSCLRCRTGYNMTTSGVCKACPPGCNCDPTTGGCTSCTTGFVLSTSQSQCIACPANCADCRRDGPSLCITCKSGFFLVDGVCKPCITGCDDCSSGLTSCVTCKTGYLRVPATGSPATCEACPANCLSCALAGKSYCDECAEGYGFTRDRKGCVACAPDCIKCNWNGYNQCDSAQCAPGFQYDSTLKDCSIQCSTNCETCTTSTNCVKCFAGYTLSGATCIQTGCTGTVTNCVACTTGTGTCVQCVDGYALKSDGTCVQCNSNDVNCLSCSLDNNGAPLACTRCAAGYIPQTGVSAPACWSCPVGCKDCTSTNVDQATGDCLNCFTPGVTPTSGVCFSTPSGASPCDANCAAPYCAITGDANCDLNCVPGWVLVNKKCVACIAAGSNCNHCLTAGRSYCDGPQCKDGYNLTPDNKCQKATA